MVLVFLHYVLFMRLFGLIWSRFKNIFLSIVVIRYCFDMSVCSPVKTATQIYIYIFFKGYCNNHHYKILQSCFHGRKSQCCEPKYQKVKVLPITNGSLQSVKLMMH